MDSLASQCQPHAINELVQARRSTNKNCPSDHHFEHGTGEMCSQDLCLDAWVPGKPTPQLIVANDRHMHAAIVAQHMNVTTVLAEFQMLTLQFDHAAMRGFFFLCKRCFKCLHTFFWHMVFNFVKHTSISAICFELLCL
jgi:hypothetical protein